MKTCPQCHTKYTDDTLKFCLQDGNTLELANEDKTLVFDQESFANDKTIAENSSHKTENYQGKTEQLSQQQTKENNQETESKPKAENLSQVTIERPRQITETPTVVSDQPSTKKSGLGFLTGLIVGLLLIGLIGLGVLAIIFLPSLLKETANTNTNSNQATPIPQKEKTISDSGDVKVSASSSRKPLKGNFYQPRLAFDGNSRTAWSEGSRGAGIGQWIVFDFNDEVNLKEIIIEPGYFKTDELWRKNNRLATASFKFSNGKSKTFKFTDKMKEQKVDVGNVKTKSVMITIKDIYPGQTDAKDTLISEVKFVVQEE